MNKISIALILSAVAATLPGTFGCGKQRQFGPALESTDGAAKPGEFGQLSNNPADAAVPLGRPGTQDNGSELAVTPTTLGPSQNNSPDAGVSAVSSPATESAYIGCANDGACSGGLNRCDPTSGTCVECLSNLDCAASLNGAVCNRAAGNPAVPANTCVQCVANGDCGDPAASRCVENQCQACELNEQCLGITSGPDNTPLTVCDLSRGAGTGVCVQCTGTQALACNGGTYVCDSLAKTCTTIGVRNADICESCVSDAQCSEDARCVLHRFEGVEVGHFCFPLATVSGCATPYALELLGATIDAEVPQPTVCLPRLATCAAYDDFARTNPCLDASDSDSCGVESLVDGVCEFDGNGGYQCSVRCISANDCGANGTCLNGVCQL